MGRLCMSRKSTSPRFEEACKEWRDLQQVYGEVRY